MSDEIDPNVCERCGEPLMGVAIQEGDPVVVTLGVWCRECEEEAA